MRRSIFLLTTVIAFLNSFANSSSAQTHSINKIQLEKKIDSLFSQFNNSTSPGCAVTVIENGEAIFSSSISFQKREKGLSHQIKMLDIPGPEGLESEWEVRSKMRSKIAKEYLPMWLREREIEMRQVEPQDLLKPQKTPPYRNTWMKPTGKLPADERIHQALLLYVSDMGLLGTAVNPHGMNFMSNKFQGASLDDAIWFHSKINFDNWLLYHIDSPVSNNARGFSRGSIYTKSGRLIASTSQEGLMRVWD